MSNFRDMMRRAGADAAAGDWSPGPGTHDAIVVDGHAQESGAGDPYAKTRLRLVKPSSPDDGREWDHLMFFKSAQQAQMSYGQLSLYGLPGEVLDNLDDVEDLARAMSDLEGLHVQVSCKPRADGDGVWTNILGSRTGKSDIPDDQKAFSLGDDRKAAPAPKSAVTGDDVDTDPIPY